MVEKCKTCTNLAHFLCIICTRSADVGTYRHPILLPFGVIQYPILFLLGKTYDVSSQFRRQNASLHTIIKVCTQECKFCTSKNGYQLCIETAGFCSFLMSISVIYSGSIGVVRRRDLTVLYFLCQQLSSRYFNPLKIVILF